MNKLNCEDVLLQILAALDGEKSELTDEETRQHLAGCENCRREIEELKNTAALLNGQERRRQEADLWPAIEKRIGASEVTASETKWQPFVLLGILLVVYKLLEMLPARDFGWSLKIAPLLLIVALFAFLKENPFKINTELMLEK